MSSANVVEIGYFFKKRVPSVFSVTQYTVQISETSNDRIGHADLIAKIVEPFFSAATRPIFSSKTSISSRYLDFESRIAICAKNGDHFVQTRVEYIPEMDENTTKKQPFLALLVAAEINGF